MNIRPLTLHGASLRLREAGYSLSRAALRILSSERSILRDTGLDNTITQLCPSPPAGTGLQRVQATSY